MAEQIRIWDVEDGTLSEVTRQSVDLESRLEDWMHSDVSVLSDDLLVIGRQLDTDGGGILDLLCLNRNGDLVIVELKRGKTPREVTAQALDYGAWATDLSFDQIKEIADGSPAVEGGLEAAFRQRFDIDLPDVLNAEHHLLIVASEVDARSERIIRYLSEAHGVSINAVTFNYFQTADGHELLARTHLIEPDAVEDRTVRKAGSKRRRAATMNDHREEAERLGVGDLFGPLVEGLSQWFDPWAGKTVVSFGRRGKWLVMFRVLTSKSEPGALLFDSSENRLGDAFGLSLEEIQSILPAGLRPLEHSTDSSSPEGDWNGFTGIFRDAADVNRFLAGLSAAPRKPVG